MAKLKIRVKTGANMNKMERMADGTFKVWVKNPAVKGRANTELLSYLKHITGKTVSIISGEKSKNKRIEFEGSKEEFISKLENILMTEEQTPETDRNKF